MGYHIYAIGKAIRALFADRVTYSFRYTHTHTHTHTRTRTRTHTHTHTRMHACTHPTQDENMQTTHSYCTTYLHTNASHYGCT